MLSEIWIFARVIGYKMWYLKKKKKKNGGFYGWKKKKKKRMADFMVGKKKLFVLYRRENIKTITMIKYVKSRLV